MTSRERDMKKKYIILLVITVVGALVYPVENDFRLPKRCQMPQQMANNNTSLTALVSPGYKASGGKLQPYGIYLFETATCIQTGINYGLSNPYNELFCERLQP